MTGVRGAVKGRGAAEVLSAAAEPAPGPAPGPSGPSIDSVSVTFEIKNLNYYDLSQPLGDFKDEIQDKLNAAGQEVTAKAAARDAARAEDTSSEEKPHHEQVAEHVDNMAEEFDE